VAGPDNVVLSAAIVPLREPSSVDLRGELRLAAVAKVTAEAQ
jgi:hypothetical protein